MTFPSEQQHFNAVTAALTATNARPYEYDDDVDPALSAYTLVTVSDRVGGTPRLTGQIGVRSVRITCRYVGETVDNVREMRRRGESALREKSLLVGAHESTPIQFETAEPVAEDGDPTSGDQWFSALSAYTYSV